MSQCCAVNIRPALVVRARLPVALVDEFDAWHCATHIPDVLSIPGIVAAYRLRSPHEMPGTHVMLFEFDDPAAVGPAMASTQAQHARGDMEQWMDRLLELTVEIYAPVLPTRGDQTVN